MVTYKTRLFKSLREAFSSYTSSGHSSHFVLPMGHTAINAEGEKNNWMGKKKLMQMPGKNTLVQKRLIIMHQHLRDSSKLNETFKTALTHATVNN